MAQLQRTAAAPATSRRESFRLIDYGYGGDGVDDDGENVDHDGGRDLPLLFLRQSLGWLLAVSKNMFGMLRRNNADANSRSLPAFSNAAPSAPSEPYVSYGSEAGSYTISY